MGRPRVLFAVLTSSFLLAGCGSGPGQVGAAAIIGDEVVSIDQVQAVIDKAVKEQPLAQQLAQQHKLDLIGREAVTQFVIHDMITKVAKREGFVAKEDQIAATREVSRLDEPLPTDGSVPTEAAAQLIVSRVRDQREVLTDLVLQQQLALKYVATSAVTFDFSLIQSKSDDGSPVNAREKAIEKAKLFASNPAAVDGIIQQDAATLLSQLQMQAAQQGQEPPQGPVSIGVQLLGSRQPAVAALPLFGVPANTVVVFQQGTQDPAWYVAVVRSREIGTPSAAAPPAQPTEPTLGQLAAVGQRFLQPEIDASSLKISPRYGVWDPVALNIAQNEATTTGIVLPLGGKAKS